MSDEHQIYLARRIRHEIDLWIKRQIREGNIEKYSVPIVEMHSLLVNMLAVVAMVEKQEKYDGRDQA